MAPSSTSTSYQHHHQQQTSNIPAPPPPTPSNNELAKSLSTVDADLTELSTLLHQLILMKTTTPTLLSSPPFRRHRSSSKPNHSPKEIIPVVSLYDSEEESKKQSILSAAESFGFFHLTDHEVPYHLHEASIIEARTLIFSNQASSLTNSTLDFPDIKENDTGFVVMEVSEDNKLHGEFPALNEFACSMKKVGLEIVERLMKTEALLGNPFRLFGPRCLIWISTNNESTTEEEEDLKQSYPYMLAMQYESSRESRLVNDSGEWVRVSNDDKSILVVIGDIAKVSSNGRFKKVRGLPQCSSPDDSCRNLNSLTITLVITLPTDSIVYPLLLQEEKASNNSKKANEGNREIKKTYHTFAFKDYAWKLYHEPSLLKDPLREYCTEDAE